jgi:hypothetical protein
MTRRHDDRDDRDNNNNVDFDKDIDVDIDVDSNSDYSVDVSVDANIDICIESEVDIEGNSAVLTFDAEAVGDDTAVTVDVVVLTIEDELSSISGTISSAVD